MATIKFNPTIDPNNALLNIPTELDAVTATTSTIFEIGDPRFIVLRLEGSNFTYATPGVPSGGILTGFSLVQNGIVAVTVTQLSSRLNLPQAEALRLTGAPGALLRYLLSGDDRATAGDGDQVIVSEGGNDTLDGGAGADYILAGDGNDIVISGLGQGPTDGAIERLIGGDGIDLLLIDRSDQPFAFTFDIMAHNVTALIDGTHLSGFEQMQFRSGSGSDVLSGGNLADTISGGGGSDSISGRGGDDILLGGDGADHMEGGSGNDLITGDEGVDALDGGAGDDTLDGGAQSDNLYGAGGNDILRGDSGTDYLEGGAGDDTLDGGTGPDVLSGSQGNDVYVVDSLGDALSEVAGEGYDIVLALASYSLSASAEIEYLSTADPAGKSRINLKGNDFSNFIVGNAGANTINGLGGADTLKGGRGRDVFVFDTDLNKRTADKILDFRSKDDSFRLGRDVFKNLPGKKSLAKEAFSIGKKAADADDRIVYDRRAGKLYYDEDGSGAAKAILFAKLSKGVKVTAADFLI